MSISRAKGLISPYVFIYFSDALFYYQPSVYPDVLLGYIRFCDKNFVYISHVFQAYYMPCLPYSPWSADRSDILWRVRIVKLPSLQFPLAVSQYFLVDLNILSHYTVRSILGLLLL
jgi:hypothetical protein